MYTHFFKHIDIKPENANVLAGDAEDLKAECDRYEAKIKSYGGIELLVTGVAADGGIGANEPGSSLASRTRIKTLSYSTVVTLQQRFESDAPQDANEAAAAKSARILGSNTPSKALTMGVGTMMESREWLLLATGVAKSVALKHAVEEGLNHMWACSNLQAHPRALVLCDDAATSELRVRTVRYFKTLEKIHDAALGERGSPATGQSLEGGDSKRQRV